MNHVHRAGRSPASLTRLAGMPLACRAAEPAVAAATRPGPSRPATHSPLPAPARTITTSKPRAGARPGPPRERLRTTVLPARLPHTIQLRVHCRDTPAGFWVSCTSGQTARRPWCLSCSQALDRDRRDVIPFDSYQNANAAGTSLVTGKTAPTFDTHHRSAALGGSHNVPTWPPLVWICHA